MMELNMEPVCREFQIPGGGSLRFNPADPALFLRLEQLEDRAKALPQTDPVALDRALKALLDETLGPGNDLHSALRGVSLFAVGGDGRTLLEALMSALVPVLQEGAEQCAENC